MNKHFSGALLSPYDPRDYLFKDIAGAGSKVQPYHSDYKDTIFNQYNSDMCGPFAYLAARGETEAKQNGNKKPMSYTCMYGMDNDHDGEGMYMRTIMNISLKGVPYMTSWECLGTKQQCRSLVKSRMTPELNDEAHKNRVDSYYACNTWREVCNAARATNGAVLIIVAVYSNWLNVGKDGAVGADSGDFQFYHFLRVKDYEVLSNGRYRIRCQNSWGEEWGDGGYCYLLSDVNKFMEASVMVDDVNEVTRKLTFPDVEDGRWSKEAIDWGVENGLLSGFEDGTLRPEEPMTREQVIFVLYKYDQSKKKE